MSDTGIDVKLTLAETIRGRRSVGRVGAQEVPKELLAELIEAAVWAPNHHGTEPWKFIVMTGEGRRVLGQAYADIAAEALDALAESPADEERAQRLDKEMAKAYRAPAVIAAVCAPSDDPRATLAEELAAAHAAVQNLLLTAHAAGLAAIWRTGAPAYHPLMRQAFGLHGSQQVVGLIYVGYPVIDNPPGRRTPAADKTVWLEV